MKSTATLTRELIKKSWLLFDYFLWLLFDLSKLRKIKKDKIRKVLIVHLGAIGELLITTPILPVLKKELNCEITYMLNRGMEAIFENNPYISNILIYNQDFKENISDLKKGNFDLAIIISPGSIKLSLRCFLAGIKYRIGGFGGFKRGPSFFFTRKTFPINHKHTIEKNLDIIRQIGIDNKNPKMEIYLSEQEKQKTKEITSKLKVKDYIIVHPGFGSVMGNKYPSRLWPLERYAQVIDYLIEKYNMNVILTGNEEETIISEKIIRLTKNRKEVIDCCGKFTLREFMALIDSAKLVIESSTGVVHIACALKTPVIDFIGRGDLSEWQPWGDKNKTKFLFHNEVCTSCNMAECRKKTTECLKAITVNEVINTADELLK